MYRKRHYAVFLVTVLCTVFVVGTATAQAVDRTRPTVTLTAPANGATVKGTVTVAASASDTGSGVNRVTFRVDGVAKTSDYSRPYTYAWDTTAYADGQHVVSARAADNAGNTSALPDPQATVTVNNAVTPPPTDTDGDGVPDTSDLCPGTPAGTTVDATGCPVVTPPTDSDGDGVPDSTDQCPGTPAGTTVDSTGCPVVTATRVRFDTNEPSTPGTTNPAFPRSMDYCASHIMLDTWEPTSHGNMPYNVPRDDLSAMGWGDGDSRFSWWSGFPRWLTRRGQVDDHYSNGGGGHAMTTTEIFSFAACRWGIREDLLRAVGVQESDWHESFVGDTCSSPNTVATGHGSFGITQVKNLNCSNEGDWGGWTRTAQSTPFNADVYGAAFRACLEGDFWYTIPAGDSQATRERGCVGAWFSGSYAPSSSYTNSVYSHLAGRDWTGYS